MVHRTALLWKLGRGGPRRSGELGLSRPPHLCTLNGLGAVDLWRQYRATGDLGPLRLLVEYNAYDAINLRGVLDRGYNRAVERLSFDAERVPEFERGDVLYDLSRLLLALEPTEEDGGRRGGSSRRTGSSMRVVSAK